MSKNKLFWKFVFIVALVVWCILAVSPPSKQLKPGIDIAGGTSMMYQIDTTGLSDEEKRDVGQNMIRIQRQRVDPGGKMNLVWRVQGADRIEIQMPLATEETKGKRETYQKVRENLANNNIDLRVVRRALLKPAEMSLSDYMAKRDEQFAALSSGSANLKGLLDSLASADNALRESQGKLALALTQESALKKQLADAEVAEYAIDQLYSDWNDLDDPNRAARVDKLAGSDEAKKKLVESYLASRLEIGLIRSALMSADGLKEQQARALRDVEQANIDLDRLEKFLGSGSQKKRNEEIDRVKSSHPELASQIDELIAAYDGYMQVAGRLDDPEDLKRMLRGSGVLDFRIIPSVNEDVLSQVEVERYKELLKTVGPNPGQPGYENYLWRKIRSHEDFKAPGIIAEFAGEWYVLASNSPEEKMIHVKGGPEWRLQNARIGSDEIGNYAVHFQLNEIGASMFLELTKNNIGRHLCILLDDEAISAPVLQSAIRKQGQITGSFSQQEVQDLVDKLNAGSLPARLGDQPISVNTVGPTMGRDNLESGLRAGIYGLIAVAVFMFCYYLIAGSLADIALFMNLLLILAAMAFSQSTFTMPGIAGLILTIGMAVDANVLIFERIREEQQRGSSVAMAIKNGYDRAFRTIFDANLTTFITAMILWALASEEVKGFALTLMIGIVSSMFTALFVTHTIFDFLVSSRLVRKEVKMFSVFRKQPSINWMGLRKVFWVISVLLVIGGWSIFLGRDENKNSKYSIEFTGGTSIHVVLNDAGSDMDRAAVEQAVRNVGQEIGNPLVAAAQVQKIGEGRKYEILTTETNRVEVKVAFGTENAKSQSEIEAALVSAAKKVGDVRLAEAAVTAGDEPRTFMISSSQTNQAKVREVLDKAGLADAIVDVQTREIVSDAVRKALAGKLDVLDSLDPENVKAEAITETLVAEKPYLLEAIGGVLIEFEFGNGKTDTMAHLEQRFDGMHFKPEFEEYGNNKYQLFAPDNVKLDDSTKATEGLSGVVIAVTPSDILSGEDFARFQDNEIKRFSAALEQKTSLPRVSQIDPSVGAKSMNDALIAIVVSLLAIIAYIWIRFGTVRFGMAAVVALVHDVSIAMGMVAASAWLAKTPVGKLLLISDFKIDLPMIAGFLTVIGYSLNDTIVVFDRIRENRGKLALLSPEIVNSSINQTLSRTILTSFTTLIVLVVMYIWGGAGLRGFNYVLIIGILVGTYSSIGIAAPLLFGTKAASGKSKS